jgi:hypothetical protein
MRKTIWLVSLAMVTIVGTLGFYYFGVKSQDDEVLDTRYFYWSNGIELKDNQLIVDKSTWGGIFNDGGIGKKYREMKSLPKELEKIEVDIVNCGGYLAAGKLNYVGDGEWKMEVYSDTVASDVAEKIKKCGHIPINGRISDWAVAVTPINKNRKYLKTPEISGREAFNVLPYNFQKEANCRGDEQDVLSRNEGDKWLDTDGDGEIDFVLISVACGSNCDGDSYCSKSLKLIKGEWIEMGFSTPA